MKANQSPACELEPQSVPLGRRHELNHQDNNCTLSCCPPASIHTMTKELWPCNVEQPWGRLWPSGLTRLWLCHTGDYPSDTESHTVMFLHTHTPTHTCTAICYCHKLLYARSLQHTKPDLSKEEGRGRMLCELHKLIRSLLKNRFFSPLNLLRTTSVNKG